MVCSLVTCFYHIKSKFSLDTYILWIKHLFYLKVNIILFTDEECLNIFQTLNKRCNIYYILKPFNELTTWKLYSQNWINIYNDDIFKCKHSPELYSIWAEKTFFVKQAIELNPFNTEYFFWCDIGSFRSQEYMKQFKKFISIKHFPKKSLLFSCVNELSNDKKEQFKIKDTNINVIDQNITCLVGGLWGGLSEYCLKFNELYHSMLKKYFDYRLFAGNDQYVMMSTILENPNIATVIKPKETFNLDKWFFLHYVLSDLEDYDESTTFRNE